MFLPCPNIGEEAYPSALRDNRDRSLSQSDASDYATSTPYTHIYPIVFMHYAIQPMRSVDASNGRSNQCSTPERMHLNSEASGELPG